MDYAGILVYAWDGDIANPNLNVLTIANNIIDVTNAWAAIGIRDIGTGTVTNVTINYNKLIRTGGTAFRNLTALTINTSGNWWGRLRPKQ